MAVAKTARVVGTERMGPDTMVLDLCAAEPLGFVGRIRAYACHGRLWRNEN